MKKVKSKEVELKSPPSGQLLKEGQKILYLSQYTLDCPTVIQVNRKEDLAILSNQIKVSSVINLNGTLSPKNSDSRAVLRVWSEETEAEFNYQTAIRGIPNITLALNKLSKELGNLDVVNLHHKLTKLLNKYEQ